MTGLRDPKISGRHFLGVTIRGFWEGSSLTRQIDWGSWCQCRWALSNQMRAQVEQSVEGSCVYSLIRRAIHSLGQGNQCYWFTSFWILAIASSDQEMNITSDFPSSTDDRLQLMSSPFLFPLLPSPLPDSPLSPPSSIPCPPFFFSLYPSLFLSLDISISFSLEKYN